MKTITVNINQIENRKQWEHCIFYFFIMCNNTIIDRNGDKNERNITLEEAIQLSIIFNTDASFWVKLQELHEAWFNKQK